MEEAISSQKTALSVRPKETKSDHKAKGNLNLAIYTHSLGRLTKNAALFDEAQTHYEEALRLRPPEKALYDWGQYNWWSRRIGAGSFRAGSKPASFGRGGITPFRCENCYGKRSLTLGGTL